jgi:hypothetical protein
MPLNKSEENLVGFSESSISIDETVSDTSTVADENEISLEIIRYPAYHFKDAGAYIVENAKPRSIRRAKSNDSLLTPKPRVANANRTCGNVVTTGSPQVATLSRDQEVLPQETSVTSPYTDGNVVTTGSPLVTTLSHGQEVLPEITSVASSYGSTSASYQCANTSESSAYSSSSAVNNCSPGLHSSSVYFFEG